MGLSHSCILVGRENADDVSAITIQGLFGTVKVVNRRLAFDECWEIVDEDDSLIGAAFEETFGNNILDSPLPFRVVAISIIWAGNHDHSSSQIGFGPPQRAK